jgi:hypothetical protein
VQAAEEVHCRHLIGKQNDEGQNDTSFIMLSSFCPQSFCTLSDFGDVRAIRQTGLQRVAIWAYGYTRMVE